MINLKKLRLLSIKTLSLSKCWTSQDFAHNRSWLPKAVFPTFFPCRRLPLPLVSACLLSSRNCSSHSASVLHRTSDSCSTMMSYYPSYSSSTSVPSVSELCFAASTLCTTSWSNRFQFVTGWSSHELRWCPHRGTSSDTSAIFPTGSSSLL